MRGLACIEWEEVCGKGLVSRPEWETDESASLKVSCTSCKIYTKYVEYEYKVGRSGRKWWISHSVAIAGRPGDLH
jgi:hypothetical protein